MQSWRYLAYTYFVLQPKQAMKMSPKPENPKTHSKKHVVCIGHRPKSEVPCNALPKIEMPDYFMKSKVSKY